MRIISIVDNSKWGLAESSRAVVYSLKQNNIAAKALTLRSICTAPDIEDAFVNFTSCFLRTAPGDILIIWNIGRTFLLSPILKILGRKVIYVYHEPVSLASRIAKTGGITKPLVTHLLLKIFVPIFDKHVLLRNQPRISSKSVYAFLPLVSECISKDYSPEKKLHLVFIGARLESRFFNLLKKISEEASQINHPIEFSFFPNENQTSEVQKRDLLSKSNVVIWNVFNQPYSQSGVTLDAIRYGIPILISKFDMWLENSLFRQASILVDHNKVTSKTILDIARHLSENYNTMALAMRTLSAEALSSKKISDTWKKIIE